jgi:hypothetical protein
MTCGKLRVILSAAPDRPGCTILTLSWGLPAWVVAGTAGDVCRRVFVLPGVLQATVGIRAKKARVPHGTLSSPLLHTSLLLGDTYARLLGDTYARLLGDQTPWSKSPPQSPC